ncbi:LuxR family transcriptional regulator [uncultured Sphingomonas sp.]|uniref:LuxR family transcriptional regulator n=1 Tax=uncultured Sphingomonas sp. TaxID=158754 RepID=UPI0035CC557D
MTSTLDAVTRELGFDYFALIHRADLRLPSPGIIHLDTYPPGWAERFIRDELYIDDPVLHAAARTALGFAWADVPQMIKLSSAAKHRLAEAGHAGLGAGFTVPSNIPGERRGSCSFAVRPGLELPKQTLLAAQLVGLFAFEAARRAIGAGGPARWLPRLSPRQRECIILAGQGKADNVIAQLLGLSENTVTNYLAAARERYGVASRVQLVICALYDGEIGFTELIAR